MHFELRADARSIEFLRASAQDGTVKEDDKESLEVAGGSWVHFAFAAGQYAYRLLLVQCIAEAFGVDPESSDDQSKYSISPASLLSILDVFQKTKAKSASSTSAPAPAAVSSTSTSAPAVSGPSEADKAQAESLKTKGNALMGQKLYDSAIEQYTKAIEIDANPVYFSNRAAAWGALGEHEKAVEDATRAIELDPKFAKAYSRLG
jgi:small glutamine-rich tetratricopeptide repeat-containing protein alpha